MKTIRKNLAILMLALFGLGIIGNNVLYGTDEMYPDPGGGGGGGSTICYWTYQKKFFSNNSGQRHRLTLNMLSLWFLLPWRLFFL